MATTNTATAWMRTGGEYAPHNGARVERLPEEFAGAPVARSNHQLAHAEPDRVVLFVDRFRPLRDGVGSRAGVRVELHGPVEASEVLDEDDTRRFFRPILDHVVVWGTTRFEPNTRNNIGQLGAYVDAPPSSLQIEAAMRRLLEQLVFRAASS